MRYRINKADLWGNNEGGYEVNDWFGPSMVELDFDLWRGDVVLDQELIAALVKAEYYNGIVLLPSYSYEIDYESFTDSKIIYITLRTSEHEELYRVEQVDWKPTGEK
jgi:hypothetical protein